MQMLKPANITCQRNKKMLTEKNFEKAYIKMDWKALNRRLASHLSVPRSGSLRFPCVEIGLNFSGADAIFISVSLRSQCYQDRMEELS